MVDVWHQFGGDLAVGLTGDLVLAGGAKAAQQRLLRRLLTNTGDYIWQMTYGAGLGSLVGQPSAALRIQGLIRGQIFNEASVARSPEPAIDVRADQGGVVTVQIRYADADTGTTELLSFPIGSN